MAPEARIVVVQAADDGAYALFVPQVIASCNRPPALGKAVQILPDGIGPVISYQIDIEIAPFQHRLRVPAVQLPRAGDIVSVHFQILNLWSFFAAGAKGEKYDNECKTCLHLYSVFLSVMRDSEGLPPVPLSITG